MSLLHTIKLLRLQGPQKIEKGQWRSQRPNERPKYMKYQFLYIFLVSLGSFGGIRLVFLLVWSSKVKKAKKAASEAQTWNSKESNNFLRQFSLFTLLEVNINASNSILSGLVINRAFKGQNVKADPKNWKIWKKCIKQKILIKNR